MKRKNILIIFAKNLVHGKVKTRLAASIGHDAALELYRELITYTSNETTTVNATKVVYYSDNIEEEDVWNNYFKEQQIGNDLGERMKHAFSKELGKGYTNAVIIGTDCPVITSQIIDNAFELLMENDVVIGPAFDGGYYLLGMKQMYQEVFENIAWSSNNVFDKTISICNQLKLSYGLQPQLHDVDKLEDLIHLKK